MSEKSIPNLGAKKVFYKKLPTKIFSSNKRILIQAYKPLPKAKPPPQSRMIPLKMKVKQMMKVNTSQLNVARDKKNESQIKCSKWKTRKNQGNWIKKVNSVYESSTNRCTQIKGRNMTKE